MSDNTSDSGEGHDNAGGRHRGTASPHDSAGDAHGRHRRPSGSQD